MEEKTTKDEEKLNSLMDVIQQNARKKGVTAFINLEEFKKLDHEGKLMELEPSLLKLDNMLKEFDRLFTIEALVKDNQEKGLKKWDTIFFAYLDKRWRATLRNKKLLDQEGSPEDPIQYNKLCIALPNDGFSYTKRDTKPLAGIHHNSFNYELLVPPEEEEIPFVIHLAKQLKAQFLIKYNLEDRRLDIPFLVDKREVLEITFEPGFAEATTEELAKHFYKYGN